MIGVRADMLGWVGTNQFGNGHIRSRLPKSYLKRSF
jgi:hypothetical protein